MANVKIGNLPQTASLNPTDILPSVKIGDDTTYKITVRNLANSLTEVTQSISASYATTASFTISASYSQNGGVTSIVAGTGISINASTGNVTITNTGGGGGGSPGGSSQQLQYNNGGAFGGVATAIYDGTTFKATGSFSGSFKGSLTGTSSLSQVTEKIYPSQIAGLTAPVALLSNTTGDVFAGYASNNLFYYNTTTQVISATASFATTSSFVVSSSYSATASLVTSASYATTASFTVSASYASTASYLNDLNQNLSITGSVIISGSPSPEIRVIGEMTITGSLIVSGTAPIRIFGSASIVSGALAVGNITASSTVGRIDASNDIVAYSTSDARLKTEVARIQDPITKVNMISGVNFTWIENPEVHGNSGRDVGVIAQELEAVLPEVVTTRENGYKAVKYEKIVPLLIEAIKDLQKQIDELKSSK